LKGFQPHQASHAPPTLRPVTGLATRPLAPGSLRHARARCARRLGDHPEPAPDAEDRTPLSDLTWRKSAGAARATYLGDQILETGFEPFCRSEPLPPIRFDEIELACWLALSPEADARNSAHAIIA
jgi:hypothetical protein